MTHKHSKLVAPPRGEVAKRNGGNGGYMKRKLCVDTPKNRRSYNLRDHHGNKYPGDRK